jgi:hypothetical protein
MARAVIPAARGASALHRQAEPGEQPAPDPTKTKSWQWYEVVGPHDVGGKVLGERVCLDLTEGQAAALVEAGHVIVVDSDTPSPSEE